MEKGKYKMQLKNQNSVPCHSERSEESKETFRFAQGDNTFSSNLPPESPSPCLRRGGSKGERCSKIKNSKLQFKI